MVKGELAGRENDDEIIVFKSLTADEIGQIVELMVAELRDRMIEQNMTINLDEAARALIAKEGTDTAYGARPLRRAIQSRIEDLLSEELLEGKFHAGDCVTVAVEDEQFVLASSPAPVPAEEKTE